MRKAVVNQTITNQAPIEHRALQMIPAPEMPIEQVQALTAAEHTQEYYQTVAYLAEKYRLIIDAMKIEDFHSVKFALEAMRDLTALLGLKAPTKTATITGKIDEYDLSDYSDIGKN